MAASGSFIRATGTILLLVSMSLWFPGVEGSRVFHDASREALQSQPHQGGADDAPVARHCSSGRCLKLRRSEPEERFLNYVTDFASSDSGLLLDDIIRAQLAEPDDEVAHPSLVEIEGNKSSTSEVQRLFANYSWDLVNAVVLLTSSLYFLYIVLTNPLSNTCISTISSHIIASLCLSLTHDLLPLWLLVFLSYAGEGALYLFLQYTDSVKRQQICCFFACVVKANLLYDLFAVLPSDSLSPSYTGFAGVIARLFGTSHFMIVRLIYTLVLLGIASVAFRNLPKCVSHQPMELVEVELAADVMKKMVCLVAAWPLAALIPQVVCTWWERRNPIGPYTFFFTPTLFRLSAAESWIALLSWGLIAVTLLNYCAEASNFGDTWVRRDSRWARASPQ